MSANRPAFLDQPSLRLLLFGGKGGVGKTTCAAAAALALADRHPDRTYLLASTDPAHSLSDSLGADPLPGNLRVLELDFRASLEQFKAAHAEHFRAVALRGTFLDEADVNTFLELSTPGFDEVMAFLEIAALVRNHTHDGLIIDTAPTGHSLRFLALPNLMRDWLRAFEAMLGKHRYLRELYSRSTRSDATDDFLADLTATIHDLGALLRDPVQCRFVPVMLAEPMSRSETARLVARLRELRIPVTDVLVNRLYPAGATCPICRAARSGQQHELRRTMLDDRRYTFWGIPLYPDEARGVARLRRLWDNVAPLDVPDDPRPEAPDLPLRVDAPVRLPAASVRLLLFAGKGGVGKTTVACATAAWLARVSPARRVLLFSTDPAHSLADCLAVNVGPDGSTPADRLTALEIDADAELRKLRALYAGEVEAFFHAMLQRGGLDLEFDHEVVTHLLDLSPPGVDEVMALLRAMELLESGRYDQLVLDTAPTGHLLRLLEMPELIDQWLRAIFGVLLKYRKVLRLPRITEFLVDLSKKLKLLRALLADPEQGQLYAVSILTEMALAETTDLLAACRTAGLRVPGLVLNLATPPADCGLCRAQAAAEAGVRGRFARAFPDIPQTVVYRCAEPRGLGPLVTLGEALYTPN